jgi:hypothetical protein
VDQKMKSTDAFAAAWMIAASDLPALVRLKIEGETITIENVLEWSADKRQDSHATSALKTLCYLADLYRVVLLGYVAPYAGRLEEMIRLRLWLTHYGFEPSLETGHELQWFRTPKELLIASANG